MLVIKYCVINFFFFLKRRLMKFGIKFAILDSFGKINSNEYYFAERSLSKT